MIPFVYSVNIVDKKGERIFKGKNRNLYKKIFKW